MAILTGPAYTISRSTGRCAATGREFQPGERHVAVLIQRDGPDALERADFSAEAWAQGPRPAGVFASWSAVHAKGAAKAAPVLGDEEALELFDQLGLSQAPKAHALRYVLALLLVRRRVLVYSPGAGGTMKLRRAGSEELCELADPGLDEAAIGDVLAQLGELMPAPASQERRGAS